LFSVDRGLADVGFGVRCLFIEVDFVLRSEGMVGLRMSIDAVSVFCFQRFVWVVWVVWVGSGAQGLSKTVAFVWELVP